MHARFISMTLLTVACASCSSPAQETPIDLVAGNYEMTVSLTGEAFPEAIRRTDFCLMPGEAKGLFRDPSFLEDAVPYQTSCTIKSAEREGNFFSVTRTCSISKYLDAETTFEGSVQADGFALKGSTDLKASERRSGRFFVSGTRTGNC